MLNDCTTCAHNRLCNYKVKNVNCNEYMEDEFMKNMKFTYESKNGNEKTVDISEKISNGLSWCGKHLGLILTFSGALLMGIGASKAKKSEEEKKQSECVAEGYGEIIFVEAQDVEKFKEVLAENPHISVEEI